MQSFPMFFRTTGRRVVIAGGGEQAAQKARLILKSDADLTIAAAALEPELQGLVASGRARHHTGPITVRLFDGAALSFIATGCPGADAALHAIAKSADTNINVVDRPELCDVITPSIVDRAPVVVAIGTEGTAPVLGRAIKTRIEAMLPPRLGALAALAGRLRPAVAAQIPQSRRRAFWAWAFNSTPRTLHQQGHEDAAARLLKSAIQTGSAPNQTDQGHIALVGAGPGARDLLTLRATQRLQEADIIFYDRLVDAEVLELARRDAERVYVGKTVGTNPWPQDRITALILAEARKGRRVVRLKSGDPALFGRAQEEISAAQALDIPIEIIPGITAASAAAASLTTSLTERGHCDTVILTTGTCQPGDAPPNWAHHIRPGTTIALYMGTRAAPQITAHLLENGAAPQTPVDIVADAAKPGQKIVATPLSRLPEALADAGITQNALCLIRFPKTHAEAAQPLKRTG